MTPQEPDLDLAAASGRLVEMLGKAGIEYELLPHRRTSTAAGEARALHVDPKETAKTLVAKGDGHRVRAVVPASGHVDLQKLAAATGAEQMVLLTESELAEGYPEFELGAVPPFGGPDGDEVIVDGAIAGCERVVLEAGVHDTSLRLRARDLVSIAHAEVADIARP